MSTAHYEIVESSDDRLVIRDLGPWDDRPTVTNDADGVIFDLSQRGFLSEGKSRPLFYYDSGGELSELLYEFDSVACRAWFRGFAPLPAPSRETRE